ncbi:Glycoside hydrolase family 4 [Nostocoides australiense Ben110]|uniref:Glycoside hydrolase family 4 n=1 Tax=Nostocoides australiense Ben110 TaxID=1193182 RepID=W6JYV0_9MICO|nr:hypothetical protein [Tetrasphaera australiensis]CCH74728.1 Glycoside hydrolase family 4 [Tetrasphaera australiensis Ben110]
MKLAILGGGGFRVPLVYQALLRDTGPARITEVALYDAHPARMDVIASVLASLSSTTAGEPAPVVTTHTDIRPALDGVDFVFAAIRVGGPAGRVTDERVAIRHGVLGQETTGAGGIAYGLRTIPIMRHIAETVAAQAPQAWLVNFTNPAGMITEALTPILGDQVIGICDSPLGLARRVARATGHRIEECRIDYAGLNHLGWLQGLTVGADDLLARFLADGAAIAGTEEGQVFGADWIRGLGAVPNEYLHYYYARREAVAEQRALRHVTRGEFLARQQSAFYEQAGGARHTAREAWESVLAERNATYMASARAGGEERHEEDLVSGGYEGVALALMRALAGAGDAELILNVRAGAQLALPADAVVEVPSRVTRGLVTPLPTSPLALHMSGLVQQVKAGGSG